MASGRKRCPWGNKDGENLTNLHKGKKNSFYTKNTVTLGLKKMEIRREGGRKRGEGTCMAGFSGQRAAPMIFRNG